MNYAQQNFSALDEDLDANDQDTSNSVAVMAEIIRLSGLSSIDYERERASAAKMLGFRTSILDSLVDKERKSTGTEDKDGKQGRALLFPRCEPWPEAVDGQVLIADLVGQIRRHVVLSEDQAIALALWVLHAHAHEAAEHSPRLHIASPEKRCGKSTLLSVLGPMVPRPLGAESITTSALFRTIEMARPTLLIDEADSFLTGSEEMRGILNAGFSRTGTVIRSVGDDFEPRQFSVSCPTIIAGIGRIPPTLEDRSVTIRLRRRLPSETIERIRSARREHLAVVGRKAARWVADHALALASSDPELPDSLGDREQDNWRPLVAIADAAGGEWGHWARVAAVALGRDHVEEEQSAGVMVMADVWSIFDDRKANRLSSAEIVAALNEMEDRPWPEWRRGKPLTQNTLSQLLKPFGIGTKKCRFGSETARGYDRDEIRYAYRRYVPAVPLAQAIGMGFRSGTVEQTRKNNDLGGFGSGTSESPVPPEDSAKRLHALDCSTVPLRNSETQWESDL